MAKSNNVAKLAISVINGGIENINNGGIIM